MVGDCVDMKVKHVEHNKQSNRGHDIVGGSNWAGEYRLKTGSIIEWLITMMMMMMRLADVNKKWMMMVLFFLTDAC